MRPVATADLRSADARAAADGASMTPVEITFVAPRGFRWLAAGIGALVALGLLSVLLGAFLFVRRPRRTAV